MSSIFGAIRQAPRSSTVSGRGVRPAAKLPGQLLHQDAVLRGHGLTPSSANSGYDRVAQAYRNNQVDPYADVAAREREMGFRHPTPYAAVAAAAVEAGMAWHGPSRPAPAWNPNVAPGGYLFGAGSVAGEHTTPWGTEGRVADPYGERIWDIRQRMNYKETGGGRDPAVPNADLQQSQARMSGRLTVGETMAQRVPSGRAWLSIRTPTSAKCTVTAQMSGGFEQSRTFWVGGGSIAAFMLADYESMKLEVLSGDTSSAQVQFAWVSQGLEAGNQQLYLPEVIVAGGPRDVPEGAFAVIVNTPDAAWSWTQPGVAGFAITPGVVAVASGVSASNPVSGSRYTASIGNNITWLLRPI
jgi:hypothetical protein